MTTTITRLITWISGERVGTDQFDNRYYQERRVPKHRRRKRWIIYQGEDEASRVPPEWNAWLHYTIDALPTGEGAQPWQKEHRPNPTGTAEAYRPPGHTLEGGHRAKATGDYEPWSPS